MKPLRVATTALSRSLTASSSTSSWLSESSSACCTSGRSRRFRYYCCGLSLTAVERMHRSPRPLGVDLEIDKLDLSLRLSYTSSRATGCQNAPTPDRSGRPAQSLFRFCVSGTAIMPNSPLGCKLLPVLSLLAGARLIVPSAAEPLGVDRPATYSEPRSFSS